MTDEQKKPQEQGERDDTQKPRSPLRTDSDMLNAIDNHPPDEFPEPRG